MSWTAWRYPARGSSVVAGPGSLRLWPEALLALGEAPTDHPRLAAGIDKRVLPAPSPSLPLAPLARVYVLEWGKSPALGELTPRDAAIAFVAGSLFGFVLDRAGQARQFEQCVRLAAAVKTLRLRRPRRLDRLAAAVAMVEADLR